MGDDEDDRSEQRAVQAAGAAEDEDQHDLGRAREAEHIDRDELRRLRQERAGDTGVARADDVDRDQAPMHRRAERRHAHGVLLDARQAPAERRMDEPARNPEHREQDGERVKIRGRADHVEAEQAEHRLHLDALQAVGAAGPTRQLVGRLEHHQADADGHHQTRQVGAAQHEKAGDEARQRREDERGDEADDRIGNAVLGEQARAVRTDAEERGVAERDDAGVAEDQVEREREQGDDRDLAQQQMVLGKDEVGDHRQQPERDLGRAPARGAAQRSEVDQGVAAHRADVRPNKPCGRTISVTTITA